MYLSVARETTLVCIVFTACFLPGTASAGDHDKKTVESDESDVCVGFAGQTPRDIDSVAGENAVKFSLAPPSEEMNLCNIHFHAHAEHKAKDFAIYAGDGEQGYGGYQCAMSKELTEAELVLPEDKICKGLNPGDTIEVHWVYTSCDVGPGPGLGSCLSDACANPDLRVETQVFTLVNDPDALDFRDMDYAKGKVNGYHQPKIIPSNTGEPVQFMGSTTGPSYTEQVCSPLQVTWRVRPQCAKLDINSVGAWCEGNVFNEDHAHQVRRLVTDPRLLAPID